MHYSASDVPTGDFISLDSMLAFVLILIFVVGGGLMESRKVKFGNETGLVLALGLIVSVFLHYLPANG